jgi:starch-binding outer membrane protein, SusD/RagB family
MTQSQMRSRIQKERFVEFAFEQIRFWDLLRWNLLAPILNCKVRHGLLLTKISDNPITFKDSLVAIDFQPLVIQTNSPVYPIQRSELQVNPNIIQTLGWENGTFDPLQ